MTEKPINATYWPISPEYTRVCSPNGKGDYVCPNNLRCGSPLEYGISLKEDGIMNDSVVNFGITSYDNFGQALLAVFYTLTAENWTPMMLNVKLLYLISFCIVL